MAIALRLGCYSITFIALYGPNADMTSVFADLEGIIDDFNLPYCIMVGDWNLTLDQSVDTLNYLHVNNPSSRQAVLDLMRNHDMFDVWRVLHPNVRKFTWFQRTPFKQGRLDFFNFLGSNECHNLVVHLIWV